MSNATEPSRQSGDRRRRHSGGGRNRNRNNNQRRDRDNQGQGGSNPNRSSDSRSPRGRRSRPPVKLSWWQKLLKAIGLYKAPSSPKARSGSESAKSDHTPKSNTRNVRSQGDEPREEKRSGRDRDNRDGRDNRDKKRQRGGDPSTVESCRVYVGNLSYDVAEQDLQELFKGVGPVRNVEIVYNRSTHRSKGYGFVEMLQQDDAVRCVEVFHDQPFMGRNMIVSGAKSKQQEEDEQEDQGPAIKASDVTLAPLPKENADSGENQKDSIES